MRYAQQQGKIRWVGISGYPMKIFREILDRAPLDVVLSYNHYTLQNTMLADLVPVSESEASRHSERRAVFRLRAAHQRSAAGLAFKSPRQRAGDLPESGSRTLPARAEWTSCLKLALQFSIRNEDLTTCVTGSANPERIRRWAEWAAMPLDQALLDEVLDDPEADS